MTRSLFAVQGVRLLLLLSTAVWTAVWMSPAIAQSGPPSQPTQVDPVQPDPVQGGTRDAADVLDSDESEGEVSSPWPEGADRWLFNADERTRAGREALDGADADAAVERFDTALRLEPDDPVARFNAGTARLTDQRPGARELLEAAVREAPDSLEAPAAYNLGNARMEASDLPGAIEAYENALRADPTFADAKHNLEVALRRLEQQQQNQQNQDQQNQDQQQQQDQQQNQDQQQDEQNQDQNQEQQEQDQQEGERNEDEQDQDQQQNQDQQQEQDQDSDETEESGGAGQGGEESPLPQFQDLPDMSAEEAAAILEAIQNMERQDRREQALEAAKKAQASGKKDW